MDFRKTEEQELLIESLEELLERVAPESYIAECDQNHRYPIELMKALQDGGFSSLGIPEEYGGTPCDTLTLMMVGETIAAHGAPFYIFGNALPVRDILMFGNEEQKKIVLDLLAKGEIPFCLGFSEPQAGSDMTAIRTTATLDGDEVIFNGQKTFQSGADRAKYCLLVTRDLENEDPYSSMSMWLVPMDLPDITIAPIPKVGWWMLKCSEVYWDNVRAPSDTLVGDEGNGFMQMMINFEIERLLMAAGSLGAAQVAYDDAVTYANQRVQFGQPIGFNQLIQEKITYMRLKIENMRNLVYKTAWMIDQDLPVQVESAIAKLYCAQAAFEVTDDAMQIFGGIGYSMDHRIQRLWRDMRVQRIGGGTDEIMIHIIGRQELKKYR
jgi:alkylation response protein AidB-like acyl-CoA dehydrogenase